MIFEGNHSSGGGSLQSSDLVERLRSIFGELTPSQRRAAQYLLQTYPQAALLPAVQVAKGAGVSEATVIRLAVALGFTGYAEFQQEARQELGRTVHKLRRATERQPHDSSSLPQAVEQDLANIRAMAETITPEDFAAAVDLIVGARQIFVTGARSSWFLAQYFGHVLSSMLGNVRTLQPAVPLEIVNLTSLGPGDLLIAFTFPRYTSVTMQVAEFAKNRGSRLICFTDSAACPASSIADVMLAAPIDSIHGWDSYTAILALMQCIIGGVGRKDPERVLSSFRRLEETYTHFDIFRQP